MFVLVALILVMMGWGAVEAARAFYSERVARDQATVTFDVLIQVERAFSAVLNAETSQRGYLITQRAEYLEPYSTSRSEFLDSIERLRAILEHVATRTQNDLVDRLDELGRERFEETKANIDLVSSGRREEALDLTNTDAGEDLTDSIRVVVGQLVAYEQQLLRSAISRAENVQDRTTTLLVLLLFGVILIFAIFSYNVWRTAKLSTVEDNLAVVEAERAKTEILARELNHRVKNLFAIVLSLIRNSSRGETDAEVAVQKIHERVRALSRAHELTSRIDGIAATTIGDLFEAVLTPYTSDADRLSLEGPEIHVTAGNVTPLGLIANEMATNAVKYGAWSCDEGGHVSVTWDEEPGARPDEQRITVLWKETGGPEPSKPKERTGFGSKLITLSIQQLDGELELDWQPDGLKMCMDFPLRNETIS